jgi:hypothetical protein
MPTAADYQHIFQNPMAAFQYPMARFHALMPPFPPFAQGREVNGQEMKEGEYKWWELFSGPQAPPAYDELFPQAGSSRTPADDIILERGAVVEDAKVSQERAVLVSPDSSASPSSASSDSATSTLDVDELRCQNATREQQEEYLARKMKKIENDRRLYFFWVG